MSAYRECVNNINLDIQYGVLSKISFVRYTCCFLDGTAYYEAAFGAGSGDIFLDDVQCSLSSSQLLECQSSKLLASNCDHSRDAGVGCEGVWKSDSGSLQTYF